jgi:arylformamidase
MSGGLLIDISPRISERLAVWPGDVPYRREVSLDLTKGGNLTLSAITGTVHLGAHTDAPCHYEAGADGIEARTLDLYYGPCQVIEVAVARGERILPRHLKEKLSAPRVLFKTGTFPDPEHFTTDFASLSPELVALADAQGVRLCGIDTPSIDPFDDKLLLAHQAIAARDMAILEGIVLSQVAPGRYTLVALPLKLEGADASPVRAALVPLG